MKLDHVKKSPQGVNGSKGLKLENICIGSTYAITINPKEQPLYVHSFGDNPKRDTTMWYRDKYAEYMKYKEGLNMSLYLEASPTGRLHFHGTIIIKNISMYVQFLKELELLNNYEIDTIASNPASAGGCPHPLDSKDCDCDERTGEQIWYEYCTKQWAIWEPYFDGNIIGYPMKIDKVREVMGIADPKPKGRIKKK